MDPLPPLSAFVASLVGLVACAAVYLGAQQKGWIGKAAVAAGVAVVLCISVLPYYLLMALENLGDEAWETAFVVYSNIATISSIAAVTMLGLLLWSRRRVRPN